MERCTPCGDSLDFGISDAAHRGLTSHDEKQPTLRSVTQSPSAGDRQGVTQGKGTTCASEICDELRQRNVLFFVCTCMGLPQVPIRDGIKAVGPLRFFANVKMEAQKNEICLEKHGAKEAKKLERTCHALQTRLLFPDKKRAPKSSILVVNSSPKRSKT